MGCASIPSMPQMAPADIRSLAQNGDHVKLNALANSGDLKTNVVNVPDEEGWTPLHWAASNLHLEASRILLENGASVIARTPLGFQPLHYSAMHGGTEVVSLLLQFKAPIDDNNNSNKYTSLHWAADNGHTSTVKVILEAGANTTLVDKVGNTALHWASYSGHTLTALLLVEHGVDPLTKNNAGIAPVQYAGLKRYKKELQAAARSASARSERLRNSVSSVRSSVDSIGGADELGNDFEKSLPAAPEGTSSSSTQLQQPAMLARKWSQQLQVEANAVDDDDDNPLPPSPPTPSLRREVSIKNITSGGDKLLLEMLENRPPAEVESLDDSNKQ